MTPIRHSVLAIDDDSSILQMIEGMLSPYGVEVIACRKTRDAEPFLGKAQAMVCDVHLEAEDGFAFVAASRRGGFSGRVVMISSDHRRSTVAKTFIAGANAYVLKPFSQSLLLQKLLPDFGGDGKAVMSNRPPG